MPFYYPNLQNDFWRVIGLVFFDNANALIADDGKGFKISDIKVTLKLKKIAIYDTVNTAVRLKGNASDNDLVAYSETDIPALLQRMPLCKAIIATGGKAAEICAGQFDVATPSVGSCVPVNYQGRNITIWRMPSTSRAYPLALTKKAAAYKHCFEQIL